MSLQDKIDLATQQLSETYKQLGLAQEELIQLLDQEHARLEQLSTEDFKRVATTFEKLPDYQERLRQITIAMASIEKRVQKLKRRAIYVEEQEKAKKH